MAFSYPGDLPLLEQADIADRAADEIMVRGGCVGELVEYDGRVCILGAIALGMGLTEEDLRNNTEFAENHSFYENVKSLDSVLRDNHTGYLVPYAWNDSLEGPDADDKRIEALRASAKELRESALSEENS